MKMEALNMPNAPRNSPIRRNRRGEASTCRIAAHRIVGVMAGVTGLEPATSGVTGRRSNQLSYTPAAVAPRRRQILCPTRGVNAAMQRPRQMHLGTYHNLFLANA